MNINVVIISLMVFYTTIFCTQGLIKPLNNLWQSLNNLTITLQKDKHSFNVTIDDESKIESSVYQALRDSVEMCNMQTTKDSADAAKQAQILLFDYLKEDNVVTYLVM